jgi:hypothetical protein
MNVPFDFKNHTNMMMVSRSFTGKDCGPGPAFFTTVVVCTFPFVSNLDAVCFLILISDFMPFVTDILDKGKDHILLTKLAPGWPPERAAKGLWA